MTHRSLPRAITLALALAAASLGPLFLAGPALAETPKDNAAKPSVPAKSEATESSKQAKTASKAKGKAKKSGASKAHVKGDKTHAKAAKPAAKTPKSKRASRETKPSPRRTKAAPKADDSPKTGRASVPSPCQGAAVSLDRGGVEADRFALVDCKGKPLDTAISRVSQLARPWGASKRSTPSRVDAGVISRLEAIARKFPGKTITLVGGPRPSGNGATAHQSGRAIDLRVEGVENRKLAEACRALADTGCGYYPNAAFVHVDVRAVGAGGSYWIDASEPGEPPRYVSSWPPQVKDDSSKSPTESARK